MALTALVWKNQLHIQLSISPSVVIPSLFKPLRFVLTYHRRLNAIAAAATATSLFSFGPYSIPAVLLLDPENEPISLCNGGRGFDNTRPEQKCCRVQPGTETIGTGQSTSQCLTSRRMIVAVAAAAWKRRPTARKSPRSCYSHFLLPSEYHASNYE